MLARSRLARYRAEVESAAEDAAQFATSLLEVATSDSTDATVAEVRECAINAIEDSLSAFGDQASLLSCELFDEVLTKAQLGEKAMIQDDLIDREKVDKKVRYLATKIVAGDYDGFKRSVRDVVKYYVKRTAFESMALNCSSANVRYARVTTGLETCAFCFMLSSRGFVYHSEATALGLHGYHEHCDCIAVPGFDDVDEDRQIEGYEPSGMRERYRMCAETVDVDGARALDPEYRKKVLKEVEERDWKWLYSGKEPAVDYSLLSGKQFRRLDDNEKSGYALLSENGFNVTVLPTERDAVANIDFMIGDQYWELKTPVGTGRRLPTRIREGVSKWDRLHENGLLAESNPKIVLDNRFSTASDRVALSCLTEIMEEALEKGFVDAMFITKNGVVKRISKK